MESGNFERCFDMFHFPVNVFPGVPGRVTADPEASSPQRVKGKEEALQMVGRVSKKIWKRSRFGGEGYQHNVVGLGF